MIKYIATLLLITPFFTLLSTVTLSQQLYILNIDIV